MSVLTQYAMDALMKAPHPEIDRRQCWNLHPHRAACTACKDVCPYGSEIFTRPNLVKDWSACTNCGLCVSACRSRCISPSQEQVQHDVGAVDRNDDTIWIGCEKSARQNTLVRECVAAVPWEAMATLALCKKIVLDLTPCGECENDACAALLRSELERLVEFFGQPLFEARFTLAYNEADAPYHVKEVSRREMFSEVTHDSKQGTKQLLRALPILRDDEDMSHSLDFRLLLNQRTKQLKSAMDPPLHYGFHLPNFTDKCFGCGKCEKACRSGALKFEDLPDGTTRVVVTPWKCSECGVCVSSCNVHGLEEMKLRQLTSLGPVIVYRLQKHYCADCGKPVSPTCQDGVCPVCRIKRRTKQRQEAAKARVEQRKAEKAAQEAAKAAEAAAAAAALPAATIAESAKEG